MGVLVYAGIAAAIGWVIFRGFEFACRKLGYRARLFDLLPCLVLMTMIVTGR